MAQPAAWSAMAPLRDPRAVPPDVLACLAGGGGLADDSRRVEPGMVFAAYPGVAGDGRPYVQDAVARGARAVLYDPEGWSLPALPVPAVAVPQLRALASRVAAHAYGDPSATLAVTGVTGTNGKTSCTHWLAQAWTEAGVPCALVGTLGTGRPGALVPTGFTTPGAVDLQAQLARLRDGGAVRVAMEVSSHGLAQGRVQGVHFELALFTNLTRDHLDYHGTMEAYGAAKAALFEAAGLKRAVLNLDDAFGAALHAQLRGLGVPVLGYSLSGAMAGSVPALQARDVHYHAHGVAFRLEAPQGTVQLDSPLMGSFNLSNLLGVLGCLLETGLPIASLPACVAALRPPPGRLERITAPSGPQVYIDYAHTPDALAQVLRALRAGLQQGRLICVFGCGGDRDAGKRPLMGRIACQLADAVVLTSDNPRSEDPERIMDAIAAGMESRPLVREVDRRRAIARALALAGPADVVLVAGKGHETTQEVAGERLPFSDAAEVRAALGLQGDAA